MRNYEHELTNPLFRAHVRIARPTGSMPDMLKFYHDGLGFDTIGSFQGRDGVDGIMLGHDGLGYHLEFTQHRDQVVGKGPTHDDLLVFYFSDAEDFADAVARMASNGFEPVKSLDPYWDVKGKTFQDADGYRVVLHGAPWP